MSTACGVHSKAAHKLPVRLQLGSCPSLFWAVCEAARKPQQRRNWKGTDPVSPVSQPNLKCPLQLPLGGPAETGLDPQGGLGQPCQPRLPSLVVSGDWPRALQQARH